MKRMRKLTMLLLILGLLLSLTGCKDNLSKIMDLLPGGMSVEKLAAKYEELNAERKMTEMTASFMISGALTAGEETSSFALDIEAASRKEDDFHEYNEIRYEGEINDLWYCDKIKSYITVEDDELVSYYYYSLDDYWERTGSGMTIADSEEIMNVFNDVASKLKTEEFIDATNLVLAEEKEIVCNREVYALEYSMSGEELQKLYDSMELEKLYDAVFAAVEAEQAFELNDEQKQLLDKIKSSAMFDLNLKKLMVNCKIYIDAETFETVQLEFGLIGVDGVVDGFVDGVMSFMFEILDEAGVEYNPEDVPKISVDLDDITVVCNTFGYDPVTIPEIPEKALIITAQESFDPDLGDGTYVIQEYGDAVRISVPEGWLPEPDWYYGLTLTKQDAEQMSIWGATETAVFTMYGEDYTEDDFKAMVAEYEEYYKSLEIYHETFQPEVEGYTVYRVNNMRLNAYYAWKPVGDGWLFVEYYDVTVQPMENTFLQMLANVSDYTLETP